MPDSPQKGPELAPGQKLGNYTIVRQIGEGGMGAVYEANQAGINRRVALKVLPKTLMQNEVFLERFMREAQSAGALNHPNIVTVYEVVQDQGHYFFSMEYVDGHTLREQLKRTGRMSADEGLGIVRKVAQALHYAWTEARIIHRDIKPDNIMLTRQGEVKVADLGLAKSTARDTTVTADGTGIGTPAYMSPEQSRGAKDIDCRADIYSLGITLFQMLTGQLPFEGETPYAVVLAHAEQPLPDPQSLSTDIPDVVSALVQRMCAKDPDQRYESPGQLVDEIDAIAQPGAVGPTQPIQTEAFRQQPTIPISQRRRRTSKSRSRGPAILAAVFGLAVLGGLGYLMFGKGGPGGSTTTTTSTRPTTVKGVVVVSPDQAREMFEYATEYAQKHPGQFMKIIDKFEEVRIECKGTVYAMKATDAIEEWRKNWDAAGDAEIAKRKALVAGHLAATDFAKARAVWHDFPKNLLTDATREKVNAEIAKVGAAVRAFAQNLKRQAAPYLAKKPGRLTAADITALTALKAKAERPPAGLDAAGKAALAALVGQIGQALAAHQEHLAALRAEALDELWQAYEPQMKGKGFGKAAALVKESQGKVDAEVSALLTRDTPLVADLFARAKENLPHLKGKTIRIGGMAMAVADVKDGKVIVRQDTAQMAFGMDKLDDETTLMLALMGEKDPGLVVRKKALFAFYYGRETEVVAKLKEAADAGADVAFYLSRLRPVLVVTSVPPGSSVAVEVKKGGAWQKVAGDAQKTPARCEVPGHGSYRVKVSKKGYLAATREVTVREVGELKLVFSLKEAGLWPPVRDGLVLHYSFDQAGDRAEDLSGEGNHGTLHGVKWTQDGKVGGAYEFDGKTTYIQREYDDRSALFAEKVPLSVVAWFRTSSRSPSVQSILGTHYAGRSDGYCLTIKTGRQWEGNFKGEIECGIGGVLLSKFPVNDGRWHHVVGTWDREQVRLFVDGSLQGSAKASPALPYPNRPPFHVGHIPNAPNVPDSRYYFKGTIDEVLVYKRALSADEVKSLYEGTPTPGVEGVATRYDVDALLAAGFEVPKEAKDKYGNPIRKGADATTDLPLEIRHRKTGMHLVFIPAGAFMMGSPEDEADRDAERERLHRVRLTEPLYMAKYEATVRNFAQFVQEARYSTAAERGGAHIYLGAGLVRKADANWRNPYHRQTDDCPVVLLSWPDAQAFVQWLNKRLPQNLFTLPTEAQWEHACRAGTATRFSFGDDPDYRAVDDYAWHKGNSGARAHPVGRKKPNPWGLYDMHGNVREWCSDWYATYPRDSQTDPVGPVNGRSRVIRGGGWYGQPSHSRSAVRTFIGGAGAERNYLGFRVALSLPDAWRLQAAAHHTPPIRDGLVLYYPFDKAGDRAEDKSGKGNHGTPHGVKWTEGGKVGGAYEFDGRSHIDVGDTDSIDMRSAITMAAWVLARSSAGDHPVIDKEEEARPPSRAYWFGVHSNRFGLLLGAGANWGVWARTNGKVLTGRWYHLAATWDEQTWSCYQDGEVVGTGRYTGKLPDSPGRLQIGRNCNATAHFVGIIDEVMLFKRALSRDEIKLLASPDRWGAVQHPRNADAPIRDGLVGCWMFDEGKGDKTADRSGRANHATVKGATWSKGELGTGLRFDGINDYVDAGNSPILTLTRAVTIETLVRVSSFHTDHMADGLASYVISRSQEYQNEANYNLRLTRTGNVVFTYYDGTGHNNFYITKSAISKGKWHHIVVTYRYSTYEIGVFIDGVRVAGSWAEGAGYGGHPNSPRPVTAVNRLSFGAAVIFSAGWGGKAGDTVNHFKGLINFVRLYDRALSADEVKILANPQFWGGVQQPAGVMPPGREALVLYYPFDRAGDRAQDLSGKGNHGKVNQAKWIAQGKFGGAYEFDGKSAYIQRDFEELSGLYPRNTLFSVAAWFKTSAASPSDPAVLGVHYPGRHDGYYLVLGNTDIGRVLRWQAASVGRQGEAHSKRPVNDGRWHHGVAVWNGKQGLLYLDGVLQASHTATGAIPYPSRPAFRVGHLYHPGDGRGSHWTFNGSIDEVMIFNRALSAAQVKALFEWKPKLGAGAAKVGAEDLLAAGFDVPADANDRYGNPIRRGKDEKTGLPLEIRHRQTGMHFVSIAPGQFLMGSPEAEQDRDAEREGPRHTVRLTEAFYLGKYEVTQAEWASVMGNNPSRIKSMQTPVDMVSWSDCQRFIKELDELLPRRQGGGSCRFSLPTGAQWEYACRAGTRSRFSFGDDPAYGDLDEYAWHKRNSRGRPQPVGQRKPNPWGLYDMHGNVWEWCQDWLGPYPKEAVLDPTGPARGTGREHRGGAWNCTPEGCRSAYRSEAAEGYRHLDLGFRVVLNLQ